MACILELGLVFAGIWLCSRSRVMLGMQEVRSPFTVFAGLILIVQLPLALGTGFALGLGEGIKAARDGTLPDVAQAKFAKKYWWLDLAVSGTAIVLAGGVVLACAREPVFLPPPPDDEPMGIVDFRRVMAEKHRVFDREFHDEKPSRYGEQLE